MNKKIVIPLVGLIIIATLILLWVALYPNINDKPTLPPSHNVSTGGIIDLSPTPAYQGDKNLSVGIENLLYPSWEKKLDFSDEIISLAKSVAEEYNTNYKVLAVLACELSNWGLAQTYIKGNNLFQVKADSDSPAFEAYIDYISDTFGYEVVKDGFFIEYPSITDSMRDFADLMNFFGIRKDTSDYSALNTLSDAKIILRGDISGYEKLIYVYIDDEGLEEVTE